MSRNFSPLTKIILAHLLENKESPFKGLFKIVPEKTDYKEFYNTLFRLAENGLIEKSRQGGQLTASITLEGKKLMGRIQPHKDGVWKIVIFDIPEKQKYVRTVLRAKLKSLHFKKWQNSIWISPFKLDEEIEKELKEIGKKFFVRLIKTTDINEQTDLEKMFK